MRTILWASVACAFASLTLAACSRCCREACRAQSKAGQTPPHIAPAFDREAERRAVWVVVLAEVFGTDAYGKRVARYVVDPALGVGGKNGIELSDSDLEQMRERGWAVPDVLRLPDGSRTLAPDLRGFDPGTIEDWSQRATDSPAPRDLAADRPIDWLTPEELYSIPIRPEEADVDEGSWRAFHRVYPGSSGHVSLSDVGFSPNFDEAVVRASTLRGGHDGACYWVLLRKRDGRWVVAEKQLEWIA
jgi:hypothetical protein